MAASLMRLAPPHCRQVSHFSAARVGLSPATSSKLRAESPMAQLRAQDSAGQDGVWKNTLWFSGDHTYDGRLEPERLSLQRVNPYRH